MNTEDPSDILGMLDSIEEAIQATQWVSTPAPSGAVAPPAPADLQALATPALPSILQVPGQDFGLEMPPGHEAITAPPTPEEAPATPPSIPPQPMPPHLAAPVASTVPRSATAVVLPIELRKYPDPPPRRLGVPTVHGTTAKVLNRFRWSGT
ncbi:MAG: hypothetical protein MUF64_01555 [Polyangiaceae bacterium]|jgi:hypothetical protein|nr:hypothetical protein [Polyangiaceae bacterium]